MINESEKYSEPAIVCDLQRLREFMMNIGMIYAYFPLIGHLLLSCSGKHLTWPIGIRY
jgi:hypothetical protein